MVIERTTDWEWVKRFMLERIDAIGSGMKPEEVEALHPLIVCGANWFVRAQDGEVEGLIVFAARSERGGWEGHACAAKGCWGRRWVRLSREVLRWFFRETCARRIVTHAKERCGKVFVRACGFRQVRETGNGKAWFELKAEEVR